MLGGIGFIMVIVLQALSAWALADSPGDSPQQMLLGKANYLLTQASSHIQIGFKPPEGSAGLWNGLEITAEPQHFLIVSQHEPLTGENLWTPFPWGPVMTSHLESCHSLLTLLHPLSDPLKSTLYTVARVGLSKHWSGHSVLPVAPHGTQSKSQSPIGGM